MSRPGAPVSSWGGRPSHSAECLQVRFAVRGAAVANSGGLVRRATRFHLCGEVIGSRCACAGVRTPVPLKLREQTSGDDFTHHVSLMILKKERLKSPLRRSSANPLFINPASSKLGGPAEPTPRAGSFPRQGRWIQRERTTGRMSRRESSDRERFKLLQQQVGDANYFQVQPAPRSCGGGWVTHHLALSGCECV
jgi:hypothetical protein